ncbi:MAG: DUF1499 domain-containing protein [Desulfuromonadaceae bacterium]
MKVFSGIIAVLMAVMLCSCSGTRPSEQLGLDNNRLRPCPDSPNCVSSAETDPDQRVLPFKLHIEAPTAWATIVESVTALPRTRIVSVTDNYLHAECRSAVFGFVDDLELHLRSEQQQVDIRSAARMGYYDFGVNRKRIKELRSRLSSAGVVRKAVEQ